MSIRQGLAADSVRLAALGADSFMAAFAAFNRPEDMKTYVEEAFSLDRLEAELQDTRSTFLLAERQGELLGYAKLRHSGATITGTDDNTHRAVRGERPVELQRMYAAPSRVGNSGVGKLLMQACIERARSDAHSTLWLGVWEHNPRAISFYQGVGFELVGNQDFMLGQARQTDLIMQLALT
jgi:ribosomal protein S18 acetylase RimI-like enzyme